MKKFVFILFIFIGGILYSQEKYSLIDISVPDVRTLREIAKLGIAVDHFSGKIGGNLQIVVTDRDIEELKKSGFLFRVLEENIVEAYNKKALKKGYDALGFGKGSMGGFYTYNEVISQLDSMYLHYPNLITQKDTVATSIEKRGIWFVKISDNPTVDENESEVFYNALTHAREPQGMMSLIYFMWYLLENYGKNNEVTYLVNNREMYFIPVVNPDGYEYNRTIAPNGGGMWRKNRRKNSDGSFGVDLNRNYGHNWGYDNVGSSNITTSDVYRGTGPFSEPETQAIKKFCESRQFKLTLNYHTYGNLLIYPWGYKASFETSDSLIFRDYANELTEVNNYSFGTGDQTVGYLVNGDADDWMYGEQTTKAKILSMTPEVGYYTDGVNGNGFWSKPERILPLAQENLSANLFLAHSTGSYFKTKNIQITESDKNGYVDPGDTVDVVFTVENFGLGDAQNIQAEILTIGSNVKVLGSNIITIGNLASRKNVISPKSFRINISDFSPVSEFEKIIIKLIDTYGDVSLDTFKILIGTPTIVFSDGAESGTSKWLTTQNWNTSSISYSGNFSFTDSPSGKYSRSTTSDFILNNKIDLTGYSRVFAHFFSRWDIERGFDFGKVQASINGGLSWNNVSGEYTSPGSGFAGGVQPLAQPGYDGRNIEWARETVNLSSYISKDFKIRFSLSSDGFYEKDGWYIDDIIIAGYKTPSISFSQSKLDAVMVSGDTLTVKTIVSNKGKSVLKFELADSIFTDWLKISTLEGSLLPDSSMELTFFINGKNFRDGQSYLVDVNYLTNDPNNILTKVTISVKVGIVVSIPEKNYTKQPKLLLLEQNYPNPFNPSTVIKYRVPEGMNGNGDYKVKVNLDIYNVLGQKVATLVNGMQNPGKYEVRFETQNLSTGIYFYRLRIGDKYVETKKLLFIE
jgi:hypothetical protein